MGTAKVSLAYLCGQSSRTGQAHGPDKSPVFMGGAAVSMRLKDSSAAGGHLQAR